MPALPLIKSQCYTAFTKQNGKFTHYQHLFSCYSTASNLCATVFLTNTLLQPAVIITKRQELSWYKSENISTVTVLGVVCFQNTRGTAVFRQPGLWLETDDLKWHVVANSWEQAGKTYRDNNVTDKKAKKGKGSVWLEHAVTWLVLFWQSLK